MRERNKGDGSCVSPWQESSAYPRDCADLLAVVSVAAEAAHQQGALEVHPVLPRSSWLDGALQHTDNSHRSHRPRMGEI